MNSIHDIILDDNDSDNEKKQQEETPVENELPVKKDDICGYVDSDGTCTLPAGSGTHHPGIGYCKYHEDRSLGNIKSIIGDSSPFVTKLEMFEKLTEDELSQNKASLTILYALLGDVIKDYETLKIGDSRGVLRSILDILKEIRQTNETVRKIQIKRKFYKQLENWIYQVLNTLFQLLDREDAERVGNAIKNLTFEIEGIEIVD